MSDDNDGFTNIRFICIGHFIATDGKLAANLIPLDTLKRCETRAQAEQLASGFEFKKRDMPGRIGFVYSIKAKLDQTGSITNTRGSYTHDVEQSKHGINKEWIAHWQTIDRAKEVAERPQAGTEI